MPTVKMPPFPMSRQDPVERGASACEAADTDTQLTREMEKMKSVQKVEQELRELEEERRNTANKSSAQQKR